MECNHFLQGPDEKMDTNKLCVALVPIFKPLSREEMEEVARASISKRFEKGEFVFQAGDDLDHLYIIHKGRVKIYRITESGKEQVLRVLESGDFMGELSLFAEETMTSYAEVTEKTEICSIPKSAFQELLLRFPAISLKILKEFSIRLNKTESNVEQVTSYDVEKRITSYLIELVEKMGLSEDREPFAVTLPMSKKDLASMIGTSQETLSRKLSAFQDRGWIEQSGQRNITILDLAALQNLIA